MAEKKKRTKKMAEEMVIVLRERNKKLASDLSTQTQRANALEGARLKLESRAMSAETQNRMFFDVIRDLAEMIPNSTAKGRSVRQSARLKIESLGITPPGTLGSSRNRKPIRRKKKA